jgi:hypothetical protein
MKVNRVDSEHHRIKVVTSWFKSLTRGPTRVHPCQRMDEICYFHTFKTQLGYRLKQGLGHE